ncbi:hypothetical protein LTR08_003865 [Meristemomyces frigidus]|nr:hypothetical protein LTR08_003865 [Meristemomyces frigidus]
MARRSTRTVRELVAVLVLALLAYSYFTSIRPNSQYGRGSGPHDASPDSLLDHGNDVVLDALPLLNPDEHDFDEQDSAAPLRRGILDSKTYKTLADKGATLLCFLSGTEAPPGNAGQSQWTHDDADYSYVAAKINGVDGVEVGSLENGVKMAWRHEQETTHGEPPKVYPPTNGQYINVFWPAAGVLFANDNYSPDYMIAQAITPTTPWTSPAGNPLPTTPLKQWSDAIFLSWLHLTTPAQRANLRFIFRRVIKNQDTLNVINTVARKKGLKSCFKLKQCAWQVPVWPGVVVRPGEEGFEALVGAPNGRGVAWLLIQHRAEMGGRTVGSVRVWNDLPVGRYQPSLMMKLVPAFEGPGGGGGEDVGGGGEVGAA